MTDNRKWQNGHKNQKYIYLGNYDRYDWNSNRKSGFFITASSKKVTPGDCDNVLNGNIAILGINLATSSCPVSVIVAITWQHLCRAHRDQKSRICHWNLNAVSHSFKDITISGFGSHFWFLIVTDYWNHLGTLSVSSLWSKTPFSVRILMTSIILLEI